MRQIQNILSHYKSIQLSEIEATALLQRVDTKFILPIHQLGAILEQTVNNYRVLCVQNVIVQNYRTLYFDPTFRYRKSGFWVLKIGRFCSRLVW